MTAVEPRKCSVCDEPLGHIYMWSANGPVCQKCSQVSVVIDSTGHRQYGQKRYEYHIQHINEEDHPAFMMKLNELGQEGWNIFQIGNITESSDKETCCAAWVYMRRRWQP